MAANKISGKQATNFNRSRQIDGRKINWPSDKISNFTGNNTKNTSCSSQLLLTRHIKRADPPNLSESVNKKLLPDQTGVKKDEIDQDREEEEANRVSIVTLASLDGRTMVTGSGFVRKTDTASESKRQSQESEATKKYGVMQQSSEVQPDLMKISQKSASRQSMASSSSQIHLPPTTTSSSAHLNWIHSNNQPNSNRLTIRQNVHLKYIKSAIVLLMAIDMIITVLVHKYAINDQVSFWLLSSYKFRFSALNLILSSIWYIILVMAILYDIYAVLLLASLVDVSSIGLLIIFSAIHMTRRIDYESVNLISLLTLFFSIVMLHVYQILVTALRIYLLISVKQRQMNKSSTR